MPTWQPIPGETPIDPSHLKVPGVTNRAELDPLEAANNLKVMVKYLSRKPTRAMAPFDYSWLLKLHREMFEDVWDWAGRPRRVDLTIGVDSEQVEPSLFELLKSLECWESSMPLLEQAVLLHHRAVQIHPFHNGNGRWGRMLANIWLKRHDHAITVWPSDLLGQKSPIRDDYIKAMKEADEFRTDKLLELHQRYTTPP